MSKYILGVVAALVLASVGVAQDMPLFTFAKLGATWEKTEGEWGKAISPVDIPGAANALSKDGATLYAGYPDRSAVWAYPVQNGRPVLDAGAPYAPLRIVAGYDNSREAREKRKANPPTLAVLALVVDPAGRIYAATTKDVQVFDPTGRLCGTLPLPHTGTPTNMSFTSTPNPTLIITIDGQAWTREMK